MEHGGPLEYRAMQGPLGVGKPPRLGAWEIQRTFEGTWSHTGALRSGAVSGNLERAGVLWGSMGVLRGGAFRQKPGP